MDILRQLRNQGLVGGDYPQEAKQAIDTTSRPQTISELLDSQIKYYESKIADLKAAKEAISPDVERALNALAKI